jgi:uncharacterized protein YndB with AHSA1/START domain
VDVNTKAPVLASAEVVIDAPVAVVWEVLSDIRNWADWNPSVSRVSMYGELEPGTDFHWKADGVSIVSELQSVEPGKRLIWTGRSPGIRALHVWEFETQQSKTRVKTRESFEGLLARLLSRPLSRMLKNSLTDGLHHLKQECERRSAAGMGS